ncbi:MAG: hypothetical protein K9M07_05480 [Simkaniaceae bacterium]|nr:hypothetical protein [Simkaniaceae bacterium]
MRLLYLASVMLCTGTIFSAFNEPEQIPPAQKTPPLVTLADRSYTFESHFFGLILQPYANNLDYGAVALPLNYGDAQPAVSPNWTIPEISTDFHFGFDVGIAGIFHDANSTLMLNWEWYHSPTDSATITVASDNMVGPFFEIGPDASSYKKAKGMTNFHFDEVNLNYGTFVNFGKLVKMNLFSGVSFMRLLQHYSTRFSNLNDTIIRTLDVPSKFIGAGPQLGLDFATTIIEGFQFVGNARASLFVGKFTNSTTYSTTSTDLADLGDQNPNIQTTSVGDKMGIVPGLEGRLGLLYEWLFSEHYMVKLEAGYQGQVYINAIRSIDMGSEVALGDIGSVGSATTGVYARTFLRTVSDFALAGPYVSIYFGF